MCVLICNLYFSHLIILRLNLQILNVVLRFAWLQTVLDFEFKFLHTQTVLAVVACLEIIRRGMWNFFRLLFHTYLFVFFLWITKKLWI